MILIFLVSFFSFMLGSLFGWKFMAKYERLHGYAEATNDMFKRMRVHPKSSLDI